MIVLIKINHPQFTFHPPLGLLYVANALKKNGFDAKIFHIPSDKLSMYVPQIVELYPLFVGFSVFTGEAMRDYAWLCKSIKSLSSAPIVWGNAHPSLLPAQCLKEEYIDIVVMGEGELTAVELARSIDSGDPQLKDIKGIGFKDPEGNVVINPERPFIGNLDDYKPEWSLVDVEYYIRPYYKDGKRTIPVSTSRGCPFDCGFCYNKKFNRGRWRAHSPDYVVKLVEELREQYSIDSIIITDDNFFVNKKRAFDILEKINLPFYCETKASYFDEEFAESLYKCKARTVLLGMESGSDRILEFINKKSTVADNVNAVSVVSKYRDISISGSFIIAFPTETEEECKQTMKLIVKLLKIKKEMNFTLGYYLPYPGSRLFDVAIEKGFVPPSKTEDWEDLDRWRSKTKISWVDWMTGEKAIALRNAVILLSGCYRRKGLIFALLRNFIEKHVLTLDVESIMIKLLLKLYVTYKKLRNFSVL